MHVGGEVDIRGLYCALSVARLTNIYSDDLFDKSAQWIVRYLIVYVHLIDILLQFISGA